MKPKMIKSLLAFSAMLFFFCITKVDAQVFQNNIRKLKTGMTVSDIEKVIGKKITVIEDRPVVVTYDMLKLKLEFTYFEMNENGPIYELSGMSTSSRKFKTDSGIGVGSSVKEVQHVYGRYKGKPGFNVSETEDDLSVFEPDYMNILTFTFKNNTVVEVKVWTADSW